MSHSKHTKRGFSLYIEKWNPSAKKYINTCALCGKSGYSPSLEEPEMIKAIPHRAGGADTQSDFSSDCMKMTPLG